MNRAQAKALSEELNASVQAIIKKHGLDPAKTSLRFTPEGDITFTMRATTELSRINTVSLYAPRHGFTEAQLSKTFTVCGKTLRVSGYNPRAHKMPWICQGSDGKSYKLSTAQLSSAINK
jgi:hypothetical protein